LRQSLRLLQLSSLDLQAEAQLLLESNIMLEPDGDTPGEATGSGDAPQEAAEPAPEATPDEATALEQDIPEELAVDSAWEDVYDLSGAGPPTTAPVQASGDGMEALCVKPGTLHDHLRWQLNLTPLDEPCRRAAEAIIAALDENGYLDMELGAIGEMLQPAVKANVLQQALTVVQAMEPAGVGAADLQECLLLQLRQLPADTAWRDEAIRLVTDCMKQLAARNYQGMMRSLGIAEEALQGALGLIRSMDPRPGGRMHETQIQYVVPDVFVSKQNHTWKVELNPDITPRVRINQGYLKMIRGLAADQGRDSMKSHLQEARWFIKSLQMRSAILLRVASAIVAYQQAFLEQGEEAMKPMVMSQVAEQLKVNESTISRVANGKYMHTPRGTYELKFFFSSSLQATNGSSTSSTAVRAMIRRWVETEPAGKPLSDGKLASLLTQNGVKVARRTVAKYREAMGIPACYQRKHLP